MPLLFKIDVSELEILHIKLLNNENMCHHLNDCGQVEATNSHGMNSNSKSGWPLLIENCSWLWIVHYCLMILLQSILWFLSVTREVTGRWSVHKFNFWMVQEIFEKIKAKILCTFLRSDLRKTIDFIENYHKKFKGK